MSIVDLDTDNNTAIGKGESKAGCSSRARNLIPKRGTKKFGTILDSSRKMVVKKDKSVFKLG